MMIEVSSHSTQQPLAKCFSFLFINVVLDRFLIRFYIVRLLLLDTNCMHAHFVHTWLAAHISFTIDD